MLPFYYFALYSSKYFSLFCCTILSLPEMLLQLIGSGTIWQSSRGLSQQRYIYGTDFGTHCQILTYLRNIYFAVYTVIISIQGNLPQDVLPFYSFAVYSSKIFQSILLYYSFINRNAITAHRVRHDMQSSRGLSQQRYIDRVRYTL
jgi:hypothetical protein